MNIQQLRYVREIARRDLNLTQAAEALHTSQPGVSRQVRELEEELGVDLFVRQGKRLTAMTPAGIAALQICERALSEIDNLKRVGREFTDAAEGTLTIAATHMQARYALPVAVKAFLKKFPKVRVSLRQGTPRELAEMVIKGEADLAVATETLDRYPELVTRPLYGWHHHVIVPPGHPLVTEPRLTLKRIAAYPIVTYDAAFSGRSSLDETFAAAGISIDVILTAIDTDVIKTYIRRQLAKDCIGIIASMAYEPKHDHDLIALDASKLFPEKMTKLAYRKNAYLRGFVQDFIELFATSAQHLGNPKPK
jgi:DNA-binding transcriptional LysR family regulator